MSRLQAASDITQPSVALSPVEGYLDNQRGNWHRTMDVTPQSAATALRNHDQRVTISRQEGVITREQAEAIDAQGPYNFFMAQRERRNWMLNVQTFIPDEDEELPTAEQVAEEDPVPRFREIPAPLYPEPLATLPDEFRLRNLERAMPGALSAVRVPSVQPSSKEDEVAELQKQLSELQVKLEKAESEKAILRDALQVQQAPTHYGSMGATPGWAKEESSMKEVEIPITVRLPDSKGKGKAKEETPKTTPKLTSALKPIQLTARMQSHAHIPPPPPLPPKVPRNPTPPVPGPSGPSGPSNAPYIPGYYPYGYYMHPSPHHFYPPPPPKDDPMPPIKEPEPFDDNPSSFKGWIFGVDNYFTFCGKRFKDDAFKCLFILNLLTKGESGRWSILQQDLWRKNQSCPFYSWEELRGILEECFGKSFEEERARIEISKIRQSGQESLLSFNRRFKAVVQLLGWSLDTDVMLVLYKQALHPNWIRAVFAAMPLDTPKKVSEWMTATERLYHNQMEQNLNLEGYGYGRPPVIKQAQPQPMVHHHKPQPHSQPQWQLLKRPEPKPEIRQESRERFNPIPRNPNEARIVPKRDLPPNPKLPCFICGEKGHWARSCPKKDQPRSAGTRVRLLTEEEILVMEDEDLDQWYELVKEQQAMDRDTQLIPDPDATDSETVHQDFQ